MAQFQQSSTVQHPQHETHQETREPMQQIPLRSRLQRLFKSQYAYWQPWLGVPWWGELPSNGMPSGTLGVPVVGEVS